MRQRGMIAATFLLLAGCDSRDDKAAPAPGEAGEASSTANGAAPTPPGNPAAPAEAARPAAAPGWDLQSSGEGVALALLSRPERTMIRLFCPAGQDRMFVNVPAFRPVGSEERLSFGSGGQAHALVADSRGDRQRGGVGGTGPVPDNLPALIAGPVSASYGAQSSGPHPAPPQQLARAFVAACREGAVAARRPTGQSSATISPCLMQGTERLQLRPLRAVGTEPFWGARIEGRCVTYSHPDDQAGTRVWTRYAPAPGGGGVWSGALGGRRFELRTRPQAGCSDGMSDRRYPIAVELLVSGERRTGCAEPL